MLRRRVIQAENHTSGGNGCNGEIVEGSPVASRKKMRNAGIQGELPTIEERSQIRLHGSGILAVSLKAPGRGVLVNDPPISVADDNDVFDAGKNRVIEG